jgi:hypothetical protein
VAADPDTNVFVPAGEHVDLDYSCTFSSLPVGLGTNAVTANWTDGSFSSTSNGTVDFDFTDATIVDGTVTVTDTMHGTLGTVSFFTAAVAPNPPTPTPSPTVYTYPITLTGTSGTCVDKPNTATFASTTPNSTTTDSASATVKVCVGADLIVTKDATPTFTRTFSWDVKKTATGQTFFIGGGTATYDIVVTQTGAQDSGWTVTGNITVKNPNTWQALGYNLADTINNGGNCTILTNGSGTLAAGASTIATYTCTYSAQPNPAGFTNTATATVTSGVTPNTTASGQATGAFANPVLVNPTVTVIDVMGGHTTVLGTLNGTMPPMPPQTFHFTATIPPLI